jgi:hypothetical protein
MRSPASSLLLLLCLCTAPAHAQQRATETVQARVRFESRTSLSVSSSVLTFHHADPQAPSIVEIDFAARARTHAGGEVVLTVEPIQQFEGPDAAVDVSFNGEGAGTHDGALSDRSPSVVGRWTGSGSRTGRVAFSLRAAAPGDYSVRLRFVLTAP